MFDQYNYFKNKLDELTEIKAVYRCSGLAQLEGVISSRDTVFPCIVVEEAPSMRLNILNCNNEDQQLSLYVIEQPERSNQGEAYRHSFATGKDLFKGMNDLPCNTTIDKSDIFAFPVGPLYKKTYGYGFNYSLIEE